MQLQDMPGQLWLLYRADVQTCGVIDLTWQGESVATLLPIFDDFLAKIWRPLGGARQLTLSWKD
jgi:hypothetical protein